FHKSTTGRHIYMQTAIKIVTLFCLLVFIVAGADKPTPSGHSANLREQNAATTASKPQPITPTGAAVEQTSQGTRAAPTLVESFDGLGFGFEGPQGGANVRNPSDNSLAVGPDHIVQIVNARMAVFTKKGKRFKETGKVLYGPVVTNAVFRGFGGQCEARNNGDAVVRYDQLAKRW